MNARQLPQTDSIQELAQFWDTHDSSDFQDELDEVEEPAFERRTDITVHLEAQDAEVVHDMAKSRGVRDADLIREWIIDRIHAT